MALRLGRVDAAIEVWGECLDHHRREEDLDRVADLHRKLGAALAVKGERKAAIENYQRGINLLKDGPPRLELVRLYEEAAWLYLQTGDNMLAIYASEKALRLAERLGETRAASRAHGIFGRVFGRIGDTEKARSNLERSVELARRALATTARRSSRCWRWAATWRSRRPTRARRGRRLRRGARAGGAGGRPAEPGGAALRRGAAGRLPGRLGRRWRCSTDASADLAEREGLVSKLCLPYALRGLLRWREGGLDRAEERFRRAHELAEQVGWSELSFQALYGLALTLRDRGAHADAVTALGQAIDVCERAGLAAQSVQATATRAVVLALAGRGEPARESAAEAEGLAERLHYPIGTRGGAGGARRQRRGPGRGRGDVLAEAEVAWTRAGAPAGGRALPPAGRLPAAGDRPAARRGAAGAPPRRSASAWAWRTWPSAP